MTVLLGVSGPQPCVSGCGIPGLDPFSGVLHQKSCESNLQDYLRLLYCFCCCYGRAECCAGTAGAITQRASACFPHRPFDFVGRLMLCMVVPFRLYCIYRWRHPDFPETGMALGADRAVEVLCGRRTVGLLYPEHQNRRCAVCGIWGHRTGSSAFSYLMVPALGNTA